MDLIKMVLFQPENLLFHEKGYYSMTYPVFLTRNSDSTRISLLVSKLLVLMEKQSNTTKQNRAKLHPCRMIKFQWKKEIRSSHTCILNTKLASSHYGIFFPPRSFPLLSEQNRRTTQKTIFFSVCHSSLDSEEASNVNFKETANGGEKSDENRNAQAVACSV